ncbi:hypothetical protein H9Q72_001332 [Fusarium xylarioides]|uniref:NFX1-type zinc finger-containing protein 1 n=1 Tax=Fusarium xylarioides TaxID=221167 RepID=A0A9P7LBQ7_9HYPO|nr:hypothetical protein H9Q72_001332 [Fusarium xylarioides]
MASRGWGDGASGSGQNFRPQVCHHFKRGHCNFGKNCKFLHDTSLLSGSYVPQTPAASANNDIKKRQLAWKTLLRKDPSNFRGSSSMKELQKFWQRSLDVLNDDDHEFHQKLAQELVNDNGNGPRYVLQTAENGSSSDIEVMKPSFLFLQVISHSSLTDQLSISTQIGTIYTLFAGTNGDRSIGLLSSLCEQALESTELIADILGSKLPDIVRVILTAFYQLLNRVTRTRLCEELPELMESVDKLIVKMAEDDPDANFDQFLERAAVLKRMVVSAKEFFDSVESSDKRRGKQPITSTFPKNIEYPGGRHDNDFADITKIAILPTYEEVVSENDEYLPSTNFTDPHVLDDHLQRHIDSMFRLVRHDILGPVKTILADLLRSDDIMAGRLSSGNPQAQVYLATCVEKLVSSKKRGTEAVLTFRPPQHILEKSPEKQQTWWNASSRLGYGTLVCFLAPGVEGVSMLFFQVTNKSTGRAGKDDADSNSNIAPLHGAPSITVKLANHSRDDLLLLTKLYNTKAIGILVDFNGVIPDTFVPILKNLQKIKGENHIAFQQWILPSPPEDQSVSIPGYARRLDFSFSLRCITKDKAVDMSLDPEEPDNLSIEELEEATGLDAGQCRGLVGALTREYALIQGPPGTGKSYLGVQLLRVLLAAKQKAHLGPILIICYTNHALDQFLKHLLDVGINRIIRIGGRSVTPELEGLNLRVVSKETQKTVGERMTLASAFTQKDSSAYTAAEAVNSLRLRRNGPSWELLGDFLLEDNSEIYEQFADTANELTGEDGDPLLMWLAAGDADIQEPARWNMVETTLAAEKDIDMLSRWERHTLVKDWMKRHEEEQTDVLFEAMDDVEEQWKNINRVHDGVNQRTLVQAEVIGLTTTSLAGRIDMLRSLKCKVVICEEAGEVKEADIISALMPGVEHLIQIGDHKQLRPQINNFDLSLESTSGQKWQLDRSQFERRAEGEPGLSPAPFAQLDVQRRMRPEVSRLIRGVYPDLKDHQNVQNLPDVVGMLDNVFWLDHSHEEDNGGDGTRVRSHSNRWETDMATALIRHLVRQGKYRAEDIALLTPYMGQLQQLKAALSSDFEICLGDRDRDQLAQEDFTDELSSNKTVEKKKLLQTIRLATVDNFQGEEAKVIVVSLVRSNPKRKVGFLRTENRINVLLSRAKHGMYLIGNAETYLNVPMWADVHEILTDANAVGRELKLCCPRHPATPITCSEPEHFLTRSPEGGCTLPCSRRLEPCGHKCQATCHSDAMHDAFSCTRPCPRLRTTCDHLCPQLCGQPCGPCLIKVHNVELPCGHIIETLSCYQTQDLASVQCPYPVERELPHCGHTASTRTAPSFVVAHTVVVTIDALRSAILEKTAGAVRNLARFNALTRPATLSATSHAPLVSSPVLGRVLTRALVRCRAQHPAIDFLATNDATRCCPVECSNKKMAIVDLLEFRSYSKINLYETPIVVLGCGHFFTSETLDGLVGLNDVYTTDMFGSYTGLKDISSTLTEKTPCCPSCKRSIRQFATKRYNRVINRAVMDDICKRFLIKGRESLQKLNHKLLKAETSLGSSRRSTAPGHHHTATTFFRERHMVIKQVEDNAMALQKMMGEENQPIKKLSDAIATSRPQDSGGSQSVTQLMDAMKLSQPSPDNQILLGARLLALEAQQVQLMDAYAVSKMNGWKLHENALGLPVVNKWFKACKELMEEANEEKLPRIFIAAVLAFAKVARASTWTRKQPKGEGDSFYGKVDEKHVATARGLLSTALESCSKFVDGETLKKRVQDMMELYDPKYEKTTPEELAAIRSAMVSGPQGMATNSGHWYNCVNGHPFAVGDCGMPMEEARCPECGEPIGGSRHRPVEGVTRAEEMEAPARQAEEPVGGRVPELI